LNYLTVADDLTVTATIDTTNPSGTISNTIGTNTGATTTISSGGLAKDSTLALSGTVSDANNPPYRRRSACPSDHPLRSGRPKN
jgi:hypothetical protein